MFVTTVSSRRLVDTCLRLGVIGRPVLQRFPARQATLIESSKMSYCDDTHGMSKELINDSRVRGIDIMRDPKINKGMAFTLRERQTMGIQGLLPPAILTQDHQVYRTIANFKRWDNDLDRYIYLMGVQDRNEKLFYRVIEDNIEMMMPVVYTPTVGLVCQKYGLIYRKPRGLFITIHDKGHIYPVLCNWPEKDIKAIVVTDGERILGLGDLGVQGMGIPVGKLSLYTALAGITPSQTLPITLDVGTNNKTMLDDPMYIGLKHERIRGPEYDAFIDEFMEAVVKRFGQNCLIQFEDFANQNAFRLLDKYRDKYCTFNDDIQGTAAVAVAGILASLRITNTRLSDNKFLFQGAGEASIGIANLLVMAMKEEGLSIEQAKSKIWLVDSKGLVTKDRKAGGLTVHKEVFAQVHPDIKDLGQVVKEIKPTAIIGAAAIPAVFTEEILKDMASFNDRPIVFALSNPTANAECTAEQAYTHTKGKCVFASGSPFDPVTFNGQTFYPGQGNNAYIFPGVALSVIACKVRHIGEDMFLKSAQALADLVTDDDLKEGRVYPPLTTIRDVSTKIAVKLAEFSYQKNYASTYPEPEDKLEFIKSYIYSTEYESNMPEVWDWPNGVLDSLGGGRK